MPIININIKNKIANGNKEEFIVCNNSDYEILFDFDQEWEKYNNKTAIVTLSNREFVPILFQGNKCKLPPLPNVMFCKVGVTASIENADETITISTTTPATINCLESAYDENGNILPPSDDIYQEILAKLNEINLEQEPYNDLPLMDGTANAGSRKEYARGDHRHPSDNTKLDLIEPNAISTQFVMVAKDANGYYQKQATGVYTPNKESYPEYTPILRGLQGQILGRTPPLDKQTDLDLINRGEFTEKLSDGLSGKVDKKTLDNYQLAIGNEVLIYGISSDGNECVFKGSSSSTYTTLGTVPIRGTNGLLYSPDIPKGNTNTRALTNRKYVDDGLSGKVDKVTTTQILYGTNAIGEPYNWKFGESSARNSIMFRGMEGKAQIVTPTAEDSILSIANREYVDAQKVHKHLVSFENEFGGIAGDTEFAILSTKPAALTWEDVYQWLSGFSVGLKSIFFQDTNTFIVFSIENGNVVSTYYSRIDYPLICDTVVEIQGEKL